MIDPTWQVEEPDPDELAGGQQPALVSLHYLLGALRRRWRFWMAFALSGLLLGITWAMAVPATSVGTATVLLEHNASTDPEQAIATELSLLRTRSVALAVIDELGLEETADDLQDSLIVTPASTTVLILDVPGENNEDAVARAGAYADSYLAFRAEQIQTQAEGVLSGYEDRLANLEREADLITRQYDTLTGTGDATEERAGDLLARRSQLNTEINSLQQTIQDTTLRTSAMLAGSHVIDPASVVPQSAKRRLVLASGSGLVVGGTLGVALVLSMALTSTRLRRREEVAVALAAPVRFSVGDLRRRWTDRLPGRRVRSGRDLEVVVRGLDSALAPRKRASKKGRPSRLAVASVDNAEVAERVLSSFAAHLTHRGLAVFVVDLSESGGLEVTLTKALGRDRQATDPAAAPVVFRPAAVPSIARGPVGSSARTATDLPEADPLRPAWDSADVVLTLAEIDPAIGVEHLKSWADQVVLLVTAGRSSAERLRTTAGLIRAAALKLPFAVMVGADRTDESLGVPDPADPGVPGARRSS